MIDHVTSVRESKGPSNSSIMQLIDNSARANTLIQAFEDLFYLAICLLVYSISVDFDGLVYFVI